MQAQLRICNSELRFQSLFHSNMAENGRSKLGLKMDTMSGVDSKTFAVELRQKSLNDSSASWLCSPDAGNGDGWFLVFCCTSSGGQRPRWRLNRGCGECSVVERLDVCNGLGLRWREAAMSFCRVF